MMRTLGRGTIIAVLALLALSIPATANISLAADEPGLREGWQWQVTIPAVTIGGKTYYREARVRLWVEMGWLMVRRTTADGDFEWQLVLARASDPQKPDVKVGEADGSLDIAYRGYFIRESPSGKFRIYREIKSVDSPAWPLRDLEGPVEQFSGGQLPHTSCSADGWRFLRIGPTRERPEFWFRFQPRRWSQRLVARDDRRSQGNLVSQFIVGAPEELFSRNALLAPGGYDVITLEKDLLIGSRVTLDQAAQGASGKTLSDCLLTLDPPALKVDSWLNAGEPPAIEALRGKVVLLGFWSSANAPSVEHLSQLEALQKKYRERDLVTLGIHPQEKNEEVAGLLKERTITFPVGIDAAGDRRFEGETAKGYYVQDRPCYFLIDKAGKIDLGLGMEPPSAAEIEKLLLHDGVAPKLTVKEWHNTPPLVLDELRDRVVVLTFLSGNFLASSPNVTGRNVNREIQALRDRLEPRGVVVIAVVPTSVKDVAAALTRHGITCPVLVDAGETSKSYGVEAYRGGTFLIGKDGRLRGGLRFSLPNDAEIEEVLK